MFFFIFMIFYGFFWDFIVFCIFFCVFDFFLFFFPPLNSVTYFIWRYCLEN